jgi:uncharacterized protein with PIN domain
VVVDTSALIAILLGEPEGPSFIELIATADDPVISAATRGFDRDARKNRAIA